MNNYTVNLCLVLSISSESIPKPHIFVNLPLKSSLMGDLAEVSLQIDKLLPQLSDFIGQFNNLVLTTNINVITDSSGNMSIDVPTYIGDSEADQISKRVNIIDRIIKTRAHEINGLVEKGLDIETRIKEQNSRYTSQILHQVNEFNRLNASYRH
jgi:hypothetical protein